MSGFFYKSAYMNETGNKKCNTIKKFRLINKANPCEGTQHGD